MAATTAWRPAEFTWSQTHGAHDGSWSRQITETNHSSSGSREAMGSHGKPSCGETVLDRPSPQRHSRTLGLLLRHKAHKAHKAHKEWTWKSCTWVTWGYLVDKWHWTASWYWIAVALAAIALDSLTCKQSYVQMYKQDWSGIGIAGHSTFWSILVYQCFQTSLASLHISRFWHLPLCETNSDRSIRHYHHSSWLKVVGNPAATA